MYDYGARNYDPALGRFSVPDPMQELYYGVNSYTYVFNNPVQLIDPTGMIVEYADDPNKSKKENRQLKREFKRSQRELNRNSSEAKSNWNTLKNSKNVHTIHLNEKNDKGEVRNETKEKDGYKSKEAGGTGGGTDIYLDLNKTKMQGVELGTNGVNIGHEEGHAFRFDQGLVQDSYQNNWKDPDDLNKSLISIGDIRTKEETEASHIENIIRAQLDPTGQIIPLRETYNNIPIWTRQPGSKGITPTSHSPTVIKKGYDYYKRP